MKLLALLNPFATPTDGMLRQRHLDQAKVHLELAEYNAEYYTHEAGMLRARIKRLEVTIQGKAQVPKCLS